MYVNLFAQSKEIDSLNNLLSHEVSREERLSALNRLTFLTRERDLSQSLIWGQRAEELATELNDSLQISRAKGNLGWIYYRLGIWDKAFRYSKDAYLIGLRHNQKEELGMVLNNLGALYFQQKKLKNLKLKKFFKTISLLEVQLELMEHQALSSVKN